MKRRQAPQRCALLAAVALLFHPAAGSALQTAAARLATHTRPGCAGVVPPGAVLVTYTNGHHWEVLRLQRATAEAAGLTCLLHATLTLCLDDACAALCAADGLECVARLARRCLVFNTDAVPCHSCLRYEGYSLGAAEARARSTNYRTITFVKWAILQELVATPGVTSALFFDDDVLLFANPFLHFDSQAYDLRHQTEAGAGCGAAPNGGLVAVRTSPATAAFLANMVAQRAAIEATGAALDQEFVMPAAAAAGATRCALPKGVFAGHCPSAQHASAPVRGVVTYHAHCCGERDAKLGLMRRFAAARAATPDARFAAVDRVPLPGLTKLNDSCYRASWSDARALRRGWAALDAALEYSGGEPRGLTGRAYADVLR